MIDERSDPQALREKRTGPPVPVAMDSDTFRRAGHALVDRIAQLIQGLPDRPVTPGESPEQVRQMLGAADPLPAEGADPEALLEEAADLLIEHSLYNGHPRFFGYITASPTPIGMLSDLLAAAVNPNVGAWTLSPMASEIEAQAVRWMAELIGYPTDCGGILVSGGNMANFVGFLAARARAGASWKVREAGLRAPDASSFTAYVSAETHTWIEKAADLFGLGTDAIRWIPTDDDLRMDMEALRRALAGDRAEGLQPMIVVGTAGSVMSGVVDPLVEIAALCQEEGIWFHVDGAYGGFGAASPEAPAELRAGIALADSVAVDPHKWLYAPLEAGCTLARDAGALRDAFAYHPPYYYFGQEAVSYVDYGLQNSRGFRALKVWAALKQAGRAGYERMISDDIRLARRLHERAAAHPELEAITQGLSISVFRYVPEALRPDIGTDSVEAYLNELNEAIQGRLERSGEAFVSNAVVGGRYCLRACIVNFNTTVADVDALPGIVARLGREVHAERAS
ncbi:MAG: aspartate aminotransferase family protein [Gemmatimonadota bacterium]|jgi:aromatic-L-amino-acid decarboxylase